MDGGGVGFSSLGIAGLLSMRERRTLRIVPPPNCRETGQPDRWLVEGREYFICQRRAAVRHPAAVGQPRDIAWLKVAGGGDRRVERIDPFFYFDNVITAPRGWGRGERGEAAV